MKTAGEFAASRYPIKVRSVREPITVVAFGDIHYGAPMFAADRFDRFIRDCKALKNPYYLLMGDHLELASSSERRLLRAGFHESNEEVFRDMMRGLTEELADKLDFMKGRAIGVVNGNHYGELEAGQNTDMYLAELLDAKYLGTTAMIRLSIDYNGKKTAITLVPNHGQGGGRTVGASLNRVQQMAQAFQGDVYFQGHDHKKGIATSSMLCLNAACEIIEKPLLYIRTGSFLKAYVDGKGNYIVDGAGAPSDLGAARFDIKLHMEGNKLRYNLEPTLF